MRAIFILLVFAILRQNVDSARILALFPACAPSHYILGSALLKELAKKGHDVTLVSPFLEKDIPKNGTFRSIVLTGFMEAQKEREKDMNLFDFENTNKFLLIFILNKMMLNAANATFAHPSVQTLLKSDGKFDVVIIEQFFNDGLKAIATHFKAPLIVMSTIGANSWINLLNGNPSPTSYVPAAMLNYSCKMSFTERLINSLMYVYQEALNYFLVIPGNAKLVKQYLPHIENDFNDILYNASLFLVNSHPSTNQPVPYVPNMIDIGGFHVKSSEKLPEDLQKFLDGAKEGVIYFCMGSNLKSAFFPIEKREALLKTFGKLKQKILWKWDEDVLPGQPKNVKLRKWFPQQEVLAHPNVKLFLTHGGLLSTTEAIYNGVPVLAIPVFGDQMMNAQNIANNGYGLYLAFQEVTEERLTERLNRLLTEPSFTQNAKTRSKIFHDRLTSPMDTATYWVEYVIRHKGAPHLRVAALDLLLYQYFLLDVIFVVLGAVLVSIYVIILVVKKLLFRKKGQKKEKLKKN